MALQSQTIRPSSSIRGYSSGSPRRRRRRFVRLALLLAVAAAAAAFFIWPRSAGDMTKSPSEQAAALPETTERPVQPKAAMGTSKSPSRPAGGVDGQGNTATRQASAPGAPQMTHAPAVRPDIAATNGGAPKGDTGSGLTPPEVAARSDSPSADGEGPLTEALKRSTRNVAREALPPDVAPPGGGGGSQPPAQTDAPASPAAVRTIMSQAQQSASANRPVEARMLYNRALHDPRTTTGDREQIKRSMVELSQTLTFSSTIVPGDPFAEKYTIESGDRLSALPERKDLAVDWRFIQRVNRIQDPARLGVGQTIKLVRGPFHAVVSKSNFRMDIYAGPAPTRAGIGPSASGDLPVYICSFSVGLGEYGSTPIGSWIVKPRSKLIDPSWKNPRTGEAFSKDDPKNPIGERWIGMDGTDATTSPLQGYGIHGTIDPGSIGREMSMGCVRLRGDDVAVVYELLTEGVSVVQIVE